jgi:type II secretory pathway component PulJ
MSCIAVKEAVWVLSLNKSGWVIYEKVLERGKLVRKELLLRLCEPTESIVNYIWEREEWGVEAERSDELRAALNILEKDQKRCAHTCRGSTSCCFRYFIQLFNYHGIRLKKTSF